MKIPGFILAGVGLVITFAAVLMPTTADGSDVYNLGLLQHQMMVFAVGLAAVVAGVALAAAGAAVEAIRANGKARHGIDGATGTQGTPRRTDIPAGPRMTDAERRAQHRSADQIMYNFLAGVGVLFVVVLIGMWTN